MQSIYFFFANLMRNMLQMLGLAWLSLGFTANADSADRPSLAAMEIPGSGEFASMDLDDALAKLTDGAALPMETRRALEKQRLFAMLERESAPWSMNHPRHRLLDALLAYQKYYERSVSDIDKFRTLFKGVNKNQKAILDSAVKYSKKFDRVEAKLKENQKLCDKISKFGMKYYNISTAELKKHEHIMKASGKNMDRVSASQSLKHFVRDWTSAGELERKNTFPCLIETMDTMFPERKEAANPLKVLLPGSGLNRLAHEIAALDGFEVVANEWSTFMNVAYRYLEANPDKNASTFHPFVDGWSHHANENDMLRKLSFPERKADPDSILVVEGDFTTVFTTEAGTYDVVLTYFFIDTARNLMAYFDTIKMVLKPGGKWINLGPLLYGTGPFVQLSLEEVIQVTEAMGFKYLDTDEKWGDITLEGRTPRGMEAVYSFNDRALTRSAYKAQFWVAEKK